jgi:exopolysaccharide biosynthesis protein
MAVRQQNWDVLAMLADLTAFGADAINLDGGGSAAMVIGNKLVNKPSDATGERPVAMLP